MSENSNRKPNRLIHETSPYLLQHAYNPVDWHAWNADTLALAKKQDKPILVSIGYATCHWCHVMERESFEDEQVASYMNEHFICVKVDREERPDVDQIYMDALQALTRQGGWPLNMFLTPDARPFYGGTYFPPQQVQGRPSWLQVMQWVINLYTTRRQQVEEQADKLTNYTSGIDEALMSPVENAPESVGQLADQLYDALRPTFETRFGGFGSAPKFPGTFSIGLLFHIYYTTGNTEALKHGLFSLRQMIKGGIYDQIGGGFARYSVDEQWLVPHFEKMLYDNALLLSVVADAYKLTGEIIFKDSLEQTIGFLEREMLSEEGGFYSALDADSEGIEGKFYVWSADEMGAVLGEAAEPVMQYYGVTDAGNWEGENILHVDDASLLNQTGFSEMLEQSKSKLLEARAKRVRPALDDKILLSWNALAVSAYVKVYEALGDEVYLQQAEHTVKFLLSKFWHCADGESILYHSYKERARQAAFLDDYANLVNALVDLYQATGIFDHLQVANRLMNELLEKFASEDGPLLYYTQQGQADILYRKKEMYDSVVPSGNSSAARVLYRLAEMLGNNEYKQRADKMVSAVSRSIIKYTSSFGNWAQLYLIINSTAKEIAVVGSEAKTISKQLNRLFIPDKVLMMATDEEATNASPLLEERYVDEMTLIYLCEQYTCQRPVESVEKFEQLLTDHFKTAR